MASKPSADGVGKKKTINGWLYIVHEREFMASKKNVFKIGRTKNFEKRFSGYPKFSAYLKLVPVRRYKDAERELMDVIGQSDDVHKTVYGTEYYHSPYRNSLLDLFDIVVNMPKFAPSKSFKQQSDRRIGAYGGGVHIEDIEDKIPPYECLD